MQVDRTSSRTYEADVPLQFPQRVRSVGTGASLRKAMVVGNDALTALVAFSAARLAAGKGPLVGASAKLQVITYVVLISIALGVNARVGLYLSRHCMRRLPEWGRILQATAATMSISIVGQYLLKQNLSRDWAVLAYMFLVVGTVLSREIVRRVFTRMRQQRKLSRPIAIVGGNVEALALGSLLGSNPALGYEVVGYFMDDDVEDDDLVVLGRLCDVERVVIERDLTGVVVATTGVDPARTNEVVRRLTDRGHHVNLSSSLRDIAAERLVVVPMEGYPALYITPVMRFGWRRVCKRVFEVTAAVAALAVFSPLLLLMAVAIKLDSPGPVLFKQRRHGRNGKSIWVLKLRTMRNDAEKMRGELQHLNGADGIIFKLRNDPRITRVGKVLRRTSLDELPQLWNIVRGDMSLVGPRPLPSSDVESAWSEAAQYRLRVRPGLTGLWQVSGRGQSGDEDLLRLDLYYVDNWSLWVDASIIARTVAAVVRGSGAY